MKKKCTLCKGTGLWVEPRGRRKEVAKIRKRIAKELKKEGYSNHQIREVLGLKSATSVENYLKEIEKIKL